MGIPSWLKKVSAGDMGHFQGDTLGMSKRHVEELSQVFAALLADATDAYPALGAEFERDLTRLEALVASRGIRVFLEDLPAVGKHLDRCLSNCTYELSGLPLTKRYSGRVVIPKLFRGLYLRVFHECGRLRDDCDVEAVFFLRQLCYFGKKTDFACSSDKIEDAVLDFVATDSELPELDEFWKAYGNARNELEGLYHGFGSSLLYSDRVELMFPSDREQLSTVLTTLDKVSSLVTTTLGSYDPQRWRFRHGPGAVSEVTGPSNKYYWKNWSDTLEDGYPIADCGFHSYSSWAGRVDEGGIGSTDPHSRLIAVPKTYSGPRLIAAEPSEHQWCQQNCWDYFCSRTRASWIGIFVVFNDQSRNQLLCTKGSETGALATVDLKSASDRVTCHAVGQYFRGNPKLLNCLRASRTRRIQQDLTHRAPEFVELKKFSTMGSANTFPVQSLMFLGVALASVLVSRRLEATLENILSLAEEVAVFGDDVIIPVDSRELFVRALEVLHFKVNTAKSFWTGRFRESCGVDSFHGVNVTPVYWKRPYDNRPETLASCVETANNYYKKWLLRTSALLASRLPRHVAEVATGSGVFGLKSRLPIRRGELRARFNPNLQRDEVLALSLIATQDKTATGGDTALLQYFTERPSPLIKWTHGVAQWPRLRKKLRWVPVTDLAPQQGS